MAIQDRIKQLKGLNTERRLMVALYLLGKPDTRAGDMQSALGLSQGLSATIFRDLIDYKVFKKYRNGREVFYHIADIFIENVLREIKKYKDSDPDRFGIHRKNGEIE